MLSSNRFHSSALEVCNNGNKLYHPFFVIIVLHLQLVETDLEPFDFRFELMVPFLELLRSDLSLAELRFLPLGSEREDRVLLCSALEVAR